MKWDSMVLAIILNINVHLHSHIFQTTNKLNVSLKNVTFHKWLEVQARQVQNCCCAFFHQCCSLSLSFHKELYFRFAPRSANAIIPQPYDNV